MILLILLKLHTLKVNALTEIFLGDNGRIDVGVGETISITLKVEGIENIYGTEIILSYNQEVLMPMKEKFEEGELLLGKHIFTAVNRIGSGELKYIATLLGKEKNLNSQGNLLRARFKVSQSGDGNIHIQRIKLLDRTGRKIAYTPQSIRIIVDAGGDKTSEKSDRESSREVNLVQDGISIEFSGDIVDKKSLRVIDIHNMTQTGIKLCSKIYEITGTVPIENQTVTIMMKYDPLGIDSKKLGIYYYHDERRKWLYMGGAVDESHQVITFQTQGISFKKIGVFENSEYPQFVDLSEGTINAPMKKIFMLGIMKGYEDFTFRPDNGVTREEFICGILQTLDMPVLTGVDVETALDTSDWAKQYMHTAKMLNMIRGYEDGSIRGNRTISIMEAAVIIDRVLKLKDPGTHIPLNDENEISPWALKSIRKLTAYDLLTLAEVDKIQVKNTVSRKETVMLLGRIVTFLRF